MEESKNKIFTELLKPIQMGSVVIGYNEEIHKDDAIKVPITLPLGAIKRLISSYLEDIVEIHQVFVYCGQSGSTEIRQLPYCELMLSGIIEALNKNGQDGKAIINEIFDAEFKACCDELDLYEKTHKNGICDDPKCFCRR
jgi:hypothetical protein